MAKAQSKWSEDAIAAGLFRQAENHYNSKEKVRAIMASLLMAESTRRENIYYTGDNKDEPAHSRSR